jgi:signal transduction histidine kinase
MAATGFNLSSPDDRILDGVERHVISDFNGYFSKNRIENAATLSERLRLARELHDGVLQSLTGAVLQLEAMSRLVDNDPQAAHERLREIQDLIVEEQRELRTWVEDMRRPAPASMASHVDLAAALERVCRRVSRWGPRVEFSGPDSGRVPRTLGDDVYRLVEEALSNVTRHARAQVARVDVKLLHDRVRIIVEDDGCGFPFHGRYDLAALDERRRGPVSLKERVASLNGTLILTSTLSGSRLDIDVPSRVPRISRAEPSARRA